VGIKLKIPISGCIGNVKFVLQKSMFSSRSKKFTRACSRIDGVTISTRISWILLLLIIPKLVYLD
jgi:hypothetical protein